MISAGNISGDRSKPSSMSNWIIIGILVILPVLIGINGTKIKDRIIEDKFVFYFKNIGFSLIILILVFALNLIIYNSLNFSAIGKGIEINEDIVSMMETIFVVPFAVAFIPKNKLYPKDISTAKELFGYPIGYFPDSMKEYFSFAVYIITGVIFEELLCRQFMFSSLNQAFNFKGDTLLIISSLLFSIGHLYQGWKGILSSFILGMILGKIFQIQETILFPIVLHLFLNLTGLVLAFKRIKELNR